MEKTIQSHRDLKVWQKAMDLAEAVYGLASKFPPTETYRLGTQITRAAASVPANIAEGNARGTRRDYANFLSVAKGSLMETETFLMLAIRLRYLGREETATALSLITEISKMLTALRSRLIEGAA
jgi:four helix bundle protein